MMTDINREINRLINFAQNSGLIDHREVIYCGNLLIDLLKLPEFMAMEIDEDLPTASDILENILDYAAGQGLLENTPVQRDLFDTRLMNALCPRPAEVIRRFFELYAESPERATDFFYRFSIAADYIRKSRTDKNISWKSPTVYGELEITINVSKPEKDPKDIARALTAPSSGYPRCLLCRENEGYAGALSHPARQTLRLIPLSLHGEDWYFQYSPYIYYNEHCIVLSQRHEPMRINRRTFENLLDILGYLPHYFIGSNADLPIVGGSILNHDHYQGGRHTFPMNLAAVEKNYQLAGYPSVMAGRVKWPMSALRLAGKNAQVLVGLADHVLRAWRSYSNPALGILAETEGRIHNTISPIARKEGDFYVLDLVLRNNRTTDEFPLGFFHPHEEVWNIKKENIGLIEAMGLAILPARLIEELALLEEALAAGKKSVADNPELLKHAAWYEELRAANPEKDNIKDFLRHEVGRKFLKCLEYAGVFKRDAEGLAAFDAFVASL